MDIEITLEVDEKEQYLLIVHIYLIMMIKKIFGVVPLLIAASVCM